MTILLWAQLGAELVRIGSASYATIRQAVRATDDGDDAQLARLDKLLVERIAQADREAIRPDA